MYASLRRTAGLCAATAATAATATFATHCAADTPLSTTTTASTASTASTQSPPAAPSSSASPSVCVVGSSNIDLIAYVARAPGPGETIAGHAFEQGFGGKGANQAVIAARLGTRTVMVSKVGPDQFGRDTVANYEANGVDAAHVSVAGAGVPTGVAPIVVEDSGENRIIIVGGANNKLTPADVEAARPALRGSRVMLTQCEVPMETTEAALRLAREEGIVAVFNPAPAPPGGVPASVMALADIIAPNETEAALLTGLAPETTETLEGAKAAGRLLLDRGSKSVLMTRGAKGCLYMTRKGGGEVAVVIPGTVLSRDKVIDTSGAGDCFLGSFAHYVASGLEVAEAAHRACAVAAISVQSHGTQTSYPAKGTVQ